MRSSRAIAVLEDGQVQRFDRKAIERRFGNTSTSGARCSRSRPRTAGNCLREGLVGPLRFTPEGRTYRFEGEASVGLLLAGRVDVTTYLVAVRGIEPRSRG